MSAPFHTTASTDPLTFRVGTVTCTKVSVGSMDNNCYLLAGADGHLVLIDAAADAARLLGLVGGRPLGRVVITHRHPDHLQALAEVVDATDAATLAGRPDAAAITHQTGVECEPVWTEDEIADGEIRLEVIGLVGHTPGSIALVLRPDDASDPTHIFTGDSLFPGGLGRTDGPENFRTLLTDVTRELFDQYDDRTVIHPGHGDATTLGAERPHLDEWRARGW